MDVAITGIGVMAPGGLGREAFWDRVLSGRAATRRVTFFDPAGFRCQVAAEADFDPAAHGLTPQEVRRMDRAAQLAVAATDEALADGGLDLSELDPGRTAVTVGNAVGCTTGLEQEYRVLSDDGRQWSVDHTFAVPPALRLPRAQLDRRRSGVAGRRRGPGLGGLLRLHLGHRRPRPGGRTARRGQR
ncbi:hypothetical protein GCM10020000_67320 [Streptomyces olivoverticillatus]